MRWFEKYAEDPSTRRINPVKQTEQSPFAEIFDQHKKEVERINQPYYPTIPAPPPSLQPTEEPVTEEPVTEEPVTEEPVTEEPVTKETMLPKPNEESIEASSIISGTIENIKTILSYVQSGETEQAVHYLQKAISDLEHARVASEEAENSMRTIQEEILKSFANAKRSLFS